MINSSAKPGVVGLLVLLLKWISFKEGELVTDSSSVANLLATLVKESDLEEDEQLNTSKAIAALMTLPKISLPLELVSRLVNLVYSSPWKPTIVLEFTLAIASNGLFESHVLPNYTTFCHKLAQTGSANQALILSNLARLVAQKRPLPTNGYDIDGNKTYPIEFSFALRKTPGKTTIPQVIQTILESSVDSMVSEDFHLFVNALVCLTHVRPLERSHGVGVLKKIVYEIAELVEGLSEEEPKAKKKKTKRPPDFVEKLGFVLSLSMLAIRQFSSNLKEDVPWSVIKSAFLNEVASRNLFYLRAADFYFTAMHEIDDGEFFTLEMLTQLYDVFGVNIQSPFREVRRKIKIL